METRDRVGRLAVHAFWIAPLLILLPNLIAISFIGIHPVWIPIWALIVVAAVRYLTARERRRRPANGAAASVGQPLLVIFSVFATLAAMYPGVVIYITDAGKYKLIYETDHHAVLEAGQEMMAHPAVYGLLEQGRDLVPGKDNMPSVIAALHPRDVYFNGRWLAINYGGAMDHYGLRVFPVGVQGEGNLLLAPGLWFWEDEKSPRLYYPSGYRKW
jgi:hypothetical protein